MITAGLTGGIGCGKSYVADLLRRRHIPVYDTDKEAKRLMMESATIRRGLVDWVGERAYMPDGTLDRERIASYLFASPLHAERINRLVHPVVQDDFLQWVDKQDGPLVVMECAILYESGFDRLVDEVLLVRAPERVCLERVMKRDGASDAQVKARMAAQMSDEERCSRAHYIINNDGNSDVEGALRDIWVKIDRGRLRED